MSADYLQSLCYLDTNVFIYLFDHLAGEKQVVAQEIYRQSLRSGLARVSVLVVSEWRNVMIRKYKDIINSEVRGEFLELFRVWNPAVITIDTICKAEELAQQYCLSPFDSLHVQSALDQHCQYFLSEDMQDGLCVCDQLEIINPFRGKF